MCCRSCRDQRQRVDGQGAYGLCRGFGHFVSLLFNHFEERQGSKKRKNGLVPQQSTPSACVCVSKHVYFELKGKHVGLLL